MRETQHHSLAKASATARLLTALPAAVAAQAPATPMTPSPPLEALVRDSSNSVREYILVRQAPDRRGKRHLKFVMDSADPFLLTTIRRSHV